MSALALTPGLCRSLDDGVDTLPPSRDAIAPELCRKLPALPPEGAGNAGRLVRPPLRVRRVRVESTRVSQVTPESPGIPRAMVYDLLRALPGDRALLPPSLRE